MAVEQVLAAEVAVHQVVCLVGPRQAESEPDAHARGRKQVRCAVHLRQPVHQRKHVVREERVPRHHQSMRHPKEADAAAATEPFDTHIPLVRDHEEQRFQSLSPVLITITVVVVPQIAGHCGLERGHHHRVRRRGTGSSSITRPLTSKHRAHALYHHLIIDRVGSDPPGFFFHQLIDRSIY